MVRVITAQSKFRISAILLLGCLSLSSQRSAAGQSNASAPPLRTVLVLPVDASMAKPGTRLYARAVHEWTGAGCHLRVNDEVEGHVVEVVRRSKSEKTSSLRFVFDRANCDHHGMVPASLVVVALIAPAGSDAPIGQAGLGKAPPVIDLPLSIDGAGAAPMRSVEQGAAINRYALTGDAAPDAPERMSLGQVFGMPGTRLQITPGSDGGNVVSATGQNARLEGRTTLILLPVQPRGAAGSGANTAPAH